MVTWLAMILVHVVRSCFGLPLCSMFKPFVYSVLGFLLPSSFFSSGATFLVTTGESQVIGSCLIYNNTIHDGTKASLDDTALIHAMRYFCRSTRT